MLAKALITKDQATRLFELDSSDYEVVIKLASLGLKASAVEKYVTEVFNERPPPSIDVSGAPKPVRIVAWSFVKDRGQYNGTYGLSAAEAGDLTELLLSDRDAAIAKITTIVSDKLRRSGSQKPVVVLSDGIPSVNSRGKHTPPSNDGGLRLLSEEIRTNSGVYGSYKFAPEKTGKLGDQAFRVPLGGGLYIFAQSKKLAVAAARVTRVKGRSDPIVVSLVGFSLAGASPKFGTDIPSKILFDGRLGPQDTPPKEPEAKAQTSV
jgi:hypothetical protein